MEISFLFVSLFNLIVCFVASSAYFQFDQITIAFIGSLNDRKSDLCDQPLRYVNWIVPLITPVLMCYLRSFRFNLHQGMIYSLVWLLFMHGLFYAIEYLYQASYISLSTILFKLQFLQIIYSLILSAVYWVNFVSLVSYFKNGEILIIESCYILITLLGNLNYQLTFKLYYPIYELAVALLLVIIFVFQRFKVELKDDHKVLPLLKFRTHVWKGPIVLSSLIESACIGGLLFLFLSPCFGLFLLTFVPTANQELAKALHEKLAAIAYLPFLVGTVFGVFFISTFSHAGVKKTIWSMAVKNLLFVYTWSLIFDWTIPYDFLNGLFFFSIIVDLLVQNGVIIEKLRWNTSEEAETISLFAPGIQALGILLSWILLSTALGINIWLFGADFSTPCRAYMHVGLLVILFFCVFNHIVKNEYVNRYNRCPAPVIRISPEMIV